MATDYAAVFTRIERRGLLDAERIADLRRDEDLLPDLIADEAKLVLTLEWDGDFPGSSGANYLSEWNGLYFFSSSDYDDEGPFDTVKEALEELEYFNLACTPKPELSSEILSLDRLLEIGRDLVNDEGDEVYINDTLFVLAHGQLVESPQ